MFNRILISTILLLGLLFTGAAQADQITIINSAIAGGSYPWDTCRANLNNNFDDSYVLINLITVTTAVDLDSIDALTDANVLQVSEFVTLSGVAAHSTDLGTFPGSTIPDNSDNYEAFESLEAAIEAAGPGVDENYVTDAQLVVIGNTEGANSGDVTIDTANGLSLVGQILSLAAATNGNSGAMTAALVTNLESLVILSGVAADSTTLGTFTGTTIPDGSDNKEALQALETAVEAGGGAFDPASPGEIGGTTPDVVNATELNITFVDGLASVIWPGPNTTYAPVAGSYGIEPEATGIWAIINGVKSLLLEGDTAVTPGTYSTANITVDQQGRITAASNGSGGSGYVTTPPGPYRDDTCTLGQYSYSVDGLTKYDCVATNTWFTSVLSDTLSPAPSIPTMASATIPAAGTTVSLLFSEAITIGSGGNGGWTLNTPTDVMTYSSGDTTDTLIYTLASTINSTDVPTITYTQPGDGLESGTGGDLASIAAAAVVNNSTQGGAGGLLAALDCYQNNGEALDTGGENVTAVSITHGTGHDAVPDASVIIALGTEYSFPANETNGLFEATQGSVQFWYKHGDDVDTGHFFAQDTGNATFRAYRRALLDQVALTINAETFYIVVPTSIWDGTWKQLTYTWDHAASEVIFYIGSTAYTTTTSAWVDVAVPSGAMFVGTRGDGSFDTVLSEFQDFKIYDTVIIP